MKNVIKRYNFLRQYLETNERLVVYSFFWTFQKQTFWNKKKKKYILLLLCVKRLKKLKWRVIKERDQTSYVKRYDGFCLIKVEEIENTNLRKINLKIKAD